jgi:hypothetical protein
VLQCSRGNILGGVDQDSEDEMINAGMEEPRGRISVPHTLLDAESPWLVGNTRALGLVNGI